MSNYTPLPLFYVKAIVFDALILMLVCLISIIIGGHDGLVNTACLLIGDIYFSIVSSDNNGINKNQRQIQQRKSENYFLNIYLSYYIYQITYCETQKVIPKVTIFNSLTYSCMN